MTMDMNMEVDMEMDMHMKTDMDIDAPGHLRAGGHSMYDLRHVRVHVHVCCPPNQSYTCMFKLLFVVVGQHDTGERFPQCLSKSCFWRTTQ